MTDAPLFPSLKGQGWSVHKKPKFDTRVASHTTGREARSNKYATPMWDFEVTFDGLDMTSSGIYGGLGAESMQTLAGFFLQCQGRANPFVYVDPTDAPQFGAYAGTGDGVTTSFPLSRTLGEYVEPVGALVAVYGVYFNGVPAYGFLAAQPNLIIFGAAPPAGVVITADFKYGYACRFSEDLEDFEEFMLMLSAAKTIAFQSVRDIVPFTITSLRTIVIRPSDTPGGGGPGGTGAGEFCTPNDWNNNYNRIIAFGGGAGGGYTTGAGGGGGAFTYRNNVQLVKGECVPIVAGPGGAGGVGGDWGIAGTPTSFGNSTDPYYILAYPGGFEGGGLAQSNVGGPASWCVPAENATSGGNGGTLQFFAYGGGAGGGAGGPFGSGANGAEGYDNSTQSGAGGGAADGGGNGTDGPAATYNISLISPGFAPAGVGGAARDGTPGGAGGPYDTRPATGANGPGGAGGNKGQGGGGGGGGLGGVNGPDGVAMYGNGDGGMGGTEALWFFDGVWYGPGGGGGSAGGVESFFDGGFGGAGGAGGGSAPTATSTG